LDGANLLLQGFLRFAIAVGETYAFLAAKETLTIKEFPNVGNAKRGAGHPMEQCRRPRREES
jgi:hypothetical protein